MNQCFLSKIANIGHLLLLIISISLLGCGPTEQEKISQAKAQMQARQWDEAISLLNGVISTNDQSQPAYNLRGIVRLEKGQAEEALADFNRSVALDSNDYRAFYNRGNAYYQIGKYQEAITDFDAAIRLQPKATDIYINRGNALVNLQNYKRAILDYSFALKLDGENYLTHFNLGRTYYLMDSLDLAKSSFEHSAHIYSTFAPTYYFLGMIALEKEEMDASCLYLQQAADLGYQQAVELKKLYCEKVVPREN